MSNKSLLKNLFGPVKSNETVEVARSHKKAERILQEAVLKADALLSEVDLITQELRGELKVGLTAMVERNGKAIDEAAKKAIEQMLADFKANLEEQTKSVNKQLDDYLKAQLEASQKEVAVLKKQKIDQFEKDLTAKANALAQTMIGRVLSPSEQEKLIIEALEKAKKDGFFNI